MPWSTPSARSRQRPSSPPRRRGKLHAPFVLLPRLPSRRLRRRRPCNRIDQVDEGVADFAVRDAPERSQQFERIAVRNELDGSGTRARSRGCVGIGIEQGADWNIEYPGDLGKPPGADPVHALFIFLYLLERDAEPPGEVALRHARDQAMSPDR